MADPAENRSLLRRRNTLIPAEPVRYTSMRDLLRAKSSGAGLFCPSSAACVRRSASVRDVLIRSRLVKQASVAYMKPTAPGSSRRRRCGFLRRVAALSSASGLAALGSCFSFIGRSLLDLSRKGRERCGDAFDGDGDGDRLILLGLLKK